MKETDDIDVKTDTWLTYFTHFPLCKKRIRYNSHPWLDRSTLQLMRRRNQIHRSARKSGEQELWVLYEQLRNRVTNQLRKSKRGYFLRKAFDVINHGILLSKLDKAKITGTSYNWFKS